METLARWESRGGKHYVAVQVSARGYALEYNGGRTWMGDVAESTAINEARRKVRARRDVDGVTLTRLY